MSIDINERIEYVMTIELYCNPMQFLPRAVRGHAAILKKIGAEEDEDSDCNMWLSIFIVYLFLDFSVYFGEEGISNI